MKLGEISKKVQESRYEHVGTKNDGDGCILHGEREEMENRNGSRWTA